MVVKRNRDLINSFKESRRESGADTEPEKPRKRRNTKKSKYDIFLEKYNNLDAYVDKFNSLDLLFYFREVAGENGYNYVITNYKKEMAVMKRAMSNYSNRDICAMIGFLYESKQNYLRKDRMSPNLLVSGWVNTIYADTLLWVGDEYNPNAKDGDRKRETYTDTDDGENMTKIGGWD